MTDTPARGDLPERKIVSLVTTVLALYLFLPAGGWIDVVLYNLLIRPLSAGPLVRVG